ncbi:unnamed protein product, partial [Laminaria digitata]
ANQLNIPGIHQAYRSFQLCVFFFNSSATTKDSLHIITTLPYTLLSVLLAASFSLCLFFPFSFCSSDFENKISAAAARYWRKHFTMLTLYCRKCVSMLVAASVSWCLLFS